MLIIGLVAAGIMGTFVVSRQASWRSGTELSAASLAKESMQDLRMAINENTLEGLSLQPGIYVDANMGNPPAGSDVPRDPGGNPVVPNPLNFPAEFARFRTDPGTAPTLAGHGDGRLVVVEDAPRDTDLPPDGIQADELALVDLDGDGQAGVDFDNDGVTDLRRVRVQVRWSSPES